MLKDEFYRRLAWCVLIIAIDFCFFCNLLFSQGYTMPLQRIPFLLVSLLTLCFFLCPVLRSIANTVGMEIIQKNTKEVRQP